MQPETLCLQSLGIENRIVRITREWFTFQPGRPAKHGALAESNGRHGIGLQDALKVPIELLVSVVENPVF